MRTRRTSRGFTLIEVVIAVTLVALIMLGLLAALRAFGETGARLEARTLQADDMRLTSAFLRQVLSSASVAHMRVLPDGANVPYFQGDAGVLEWLAPMPARHGVGGLHRMRLSVRENGGFNQLVLQFVPYVANIDVNRSISLGDEIDWSAQPAQPLIEHLDAFSIRYQRLGQADWQEAWADPMVLPGRLSIRMAGAGVLWPELIIPILAAEPGTEGLVSNLAGGGGVQ